MDIELERLGRAVKQAQYRQHRAADAALGAIGTSLAQWDALRAIHALPGASAHQLAVATFQSDQAFGTLATRLESQGLIVRSTGEGRRIEHRLSPQGQRVLAEANVIMDRVREEIFSPLTKADRRALTGILERLLRNDPTPLLDGPKEEGPPRGRSIRR